ncbi:hypothetical protein [Falsiroseomonas ponticola]|uniref:hypothetical protein n=1 Tax=Falsiroseomonas ponticola TaxID=2786951 RepID=UPI0019311B69|nr:hypothetical protein [Roseomonas ponticola]
MIFSPQWHALGREAELAAEQLATGVTQLGRANHAQKGLYLQAFFALSIGLERLAKLVLVADHAINNGGAWMDDATLKKVGHDIDALLRASEAVGLSLGLQEAWGARPSSPIHAAIIGNLTDFAKLSRYYNLASLSGGKASQLPEPIQRWWNEVATPILALHGGGRRAMARRDQVAAFAVPLEGVSVVIHHAEGGLPIRSVEAMMQQAQSAPVVQRYGRLYVMQIIRWLSTILVELASKGAYQHRLEAFLALPEPFALFRNDDTYLLGRKRWSCYRLGH